jgi:hypothetical protein
MVPPERHERGVILGSTLADAATSGAASDSAAKMPPVWNQRVLLPR